jgi:hypothetical protein
MSHPSTHHVYQPGEFLPGTVYVVRKKLGAGGMGVVYEVEDTSIGKIYVVKTVHLHHAGKAIYSSLTRNEARMLAKLRHRNIVEVITAGTTADANQLAYFVMEKLEGARWARCAVSPCPWAMSGRSVASLLACRAGRSRSSPLTPPHRTTP